MLENLQLRIYNHSIVKRNGIFIEKSLPKSFIYVSLESKSTFPPKKSSKSPSIKRNFLTLEQHPNPLNTLNNRNSSKSWQTRYFVGTKAVWMLMDRCFLVPLIRSNPRFVRGIARFRRIKTNRGKKHARPDDKSKRFASFDTRNR